MWAQMPDVMLAKCAESLALRKGFPHELSGLYTADEMGQAAADANPVRVPSPNEIEHQEPATTEGPHKLVPQENDTFTIWGKRYVEAFGTSKSMGELMQWSTLNKKALGTVQTKAPTIYERIMKRFDEAKAKLQRASISTSDIPSAPTEARPAGMPDASNEPDAFIVWCAKRMAAITSMEELDLIFENEIDPAADGMFPPDYAAVQAEYEANKKRLGED
jgi:hypothetical protein